MVFLVEYSTWFDAENYNRWRNKISVISNRNSFRVLFLPYILCENINILASEMTSPWNQHCAICIGALSFPIGIHLNVPSGVNAVSCKFLFSPHSVDSCSGLRSAVMIQ